MLPENMLPFFRTLQSRADDLPQLAPSLGTQHTFELPFTFFSAYAGNTALEKDVVQEHSAPRSLPAAMPYAMQT